ncbi:hypothetical protein [Legionella feeleii]|uniref:Uncharacterized protein n=1 Tax=Legionella feeleii TaxID=453 RepID=A0A378IRV2_9GAMM|nr:hypothetical protein [Legionella feeleii]STX37315.1 Uncharacterised protein [Legionella feeleii]
MLEQKPKRYRYPLEIISMRYEVITDLMTATEMFQSGCCIAGLK